MAITTGKIGARNMHGQIKRRTRHKLLIVDIAAKTARNDQGAEPLIFRRCNPHDAEKWLQWNIHTEGQTADHFGVQRNVHNAAFRKLVRQRTLQGVDQVETPILATLDIQDIYLQHVPGLSAFHGHRPG